MMSRIPMRGTTMLALFVLVAAVSSCAPSAAVTPVLAARSAYVQDFAVDGGIEATFDAVLRVGQEINLNVLSADRGSGVIRFEPATLSPQQLSLFCFYPYIHPQTGNEWSTFQEWNMRTGGAVWGKATYTFLITRATKGTNVNVRANWVAQSADESFVVNSRGVSERDFLDKVRAIVER